MNILAKILLLSVSLLWVQAHALTFPLPPDGQQVVGKIYMHTAKKGESLASIGAPYGITPLDMKKANPHLTLGKIKAKTGVVIPQAFVLPDGPHQGIVINIPEMRLYYYHSKRKIVMIYPIGIGRVGWNTPTGKTTVIEKIIHPEWRVPPSIQKSMAEKGIELPDVVEAGPENPLGDFALRLDMPGYLVHGTNRPASVGKRSSSGCIRLLPQDIAELFPEVPLNTPVRIVDQAHKVGWLNGELFLESHKPFRDQTISQMGSGIRTAILNVSGYSAGKINWQRVYKTAGEHLGYPRFIMK